MCEGVACVPYRTCPHVGRLCPALGARTGWPSCVRPWTTVQGFQGRGAHEVVHLQAEGGPVVFQTAGGVAVVMKVEKASCA